MKNSSVNMFPADTVDTATYTGPAINVGQIVSASFVPVFGDATAAGTVKIQCSNDNPNPSGKGIGASAGGAFVPTNWADISNATSAISSGAGTAIVIPNMCFYFIRAVYTKTSGGSTTMQVIMNQLSV